MSTEVPEILLAHYLKILKLPTFQREYQKLARLCATEGVDHVGYLFRLAEREMIERDRRKGVVCGRGRNPTLRLWPAIFSGEIDVFPSERRNMGQEIGR